MGKRTYSEAFGSVSLLITLSNPPDMAEPTTPKPSRVTSIQLESNIGCTPSHPTSHFDSSTTIVEARENLVASLTSRMTFNDPNVIDVLIKPFKVNDNYVKKVVGNISKHKEFMKFFSSLRKQSISRESEMYKPLVGPDIASLRSRPYTFPFQVRFDVLHY